MQLSDFDIEGKLAEGGLGEVLAATEKSNGRRVVLKRPKSTAQQSHERLRDEGWLGLRVNGTAFVETVGSFEHDGVPYVVIERLDGVTVNELWRRSGALSYAAVAKLGAEVCLALAVLHALRDDKGKPLGAIHRDISSRNVMVERNGRVRVIDLGAAYSATDEREAQSAVGVVVGTLPYLAPELFEGGESTSARDIWAVGVMLLEAALGKVFTRKEPLENTLDGLRRVRARTLSPFGDPAVDALEPRLLAVLKQMLSINPAERIDAKSAAVELSVIYAGTIPQTELARRVGQVLRGPAQPTTTSKPTTAATQLVTKSMVANVAAAVDEDGPTILDPAPRAASLEAEGPTLNERTQKNAAASDDHAPTEESIDASDVDLTTKRVIAAAMPSVPLTEEQSLDVGGRRLTQAQARLVAVVCLVVGAAALLGVGFASR